MPAITAPAPFMTSRTSGSSEGTANGFIRSPKPSIGWDSTIRLKVSSRPAATHTRAVQVRTGPSAWPCGKSRNIKMTPQRTGSYSQDVTQAASLPSGSDGSRSKA